MIKNVERLTIERARVELASRIRYPVGSEAFTQAVREWGQADTLDLLNSPGAARLIDWCVLQGFRTKRCPIITLRTCRLVDDAFRIVRLGAFERSTMQNAIGVRGDLRGTDGFQLLDLLIRLERHGLDVRAFNEARREVSPAQVRLVHAAFKQVEFDDRHIGLSLQEFAGVNTPADLDHRGFDLVMLYLETFGFKRDGLLSAKGAYGIRRGFASEQQISLIRTLWAEWSGTDNDAALNAWLERFHKVSTLRFLTAPDASKVITALKAMKRRCVEARQVSA